MREQMTHVVFRSWIGLLVLGLSGCGGKSIDKSDLPGVYLADFGFATDTLIIKPDGRFFQTVIIKSDGRKVTKNGFWRFLSKNRSIVLEQNYMLVIDGFSKMVPNFDRPNTNAAIIGPVRCRFGRLEIGGDDWLWGRSGVEAPYKKQRRPNEGVTH
jgi:hypothetical protein